MFRILASVWELLNIMSGEREGDKSLWLCWAEILKVDGYHYNLQNPVTVGGACYLLPVSGARNDRFELPIQLYIVRTTGKMRYRGQRFDVEPDAIHLV